MKHYEAYTDGAYSLARDQGGIGLIILNNGEPILSYNKGIQNTTNNRMEMLAVITALKCIKKPIDSFTIYSDSMYVIGCATMGWKKTKNLDLWEEYDKAYKQASLLCPEITYKHVKGHEGDEFNEKVDKLAVEASQWIIG